MGIQLEIVKLDAKRRYTTGDNVHGVVRVRLSRSMEISDVTISLKGSVRTFLIEKGPAFILGNDVPKVAEEHHKLFTTSKVLFPHDNIQPSSTPKGVVLHRGEYTIPFELSFPATSTCSSSQPGFKHVETVLPPSFEGQATDHGAEARVEYVVRAEVNRPGRLKKGASTHQNLRFSPPDPSPHSLPFSNSGWCTGRGPLHAGLSPVISTFSSGTPSRELPILLLEARVPYPPILYPGGPLPLHLSIQSLPTHMQLVPTTRIRALSINLYGSTFAKAGIHHASWKSTTELFHLDSLSRLVNCGQYMEELSDLNRTILDDTTLPELTTSFTTCTVEQTYTLEVEAWFSVGKNDALKSVKISINVELWSGNNTENGITGASPSHQDAHEHARSVISLRPGLLAHLAGGAGDRDDRGPPPYR
ncbi:hypothetical protein BJY04DRAFT_223152 [Aspergillus karnatakaensis]|uniref:uncharacterized protein n=1 Tax=Aspergillus karnatakaensis TaxID=1810916 RepID=UPI003CCDFB71